MREHEYDRAGNLLIRESDRADTQPFLDASDAGVTPIVSFPDSHVYAITHNAR